MPLVSSRCCKIFVRIPSISAMIICTFPVFFLSVMNSASIASWSALNSENTYRFQFEGALPELLLLKISTSSISLHNLAMLRNCYHSPSKRRHELNLFYSFSNRVISVRVLLSEKYLFSVNGIHWND